MKDENGRTGRPAPGGLSTGIRRPVGTNGDRPVLPTSFAVPEPVKRRRFNRIGIVLAFAVAMIMVPFTLRHQNTRLGQAGAKRSGSAQEQGRISGLDGATEGEAVQRFGKPTVIHYYPMSEGSVAGPKVGLKRYYRLDAPDYESRTKGAEVVWTYPEYITVRELIWEQPDAFLTVWLREPRAEVDISNPDDAAVAMSDSGKGNWIVLDSYRVDKESLRKTPGQTAR